ncbi:MAG: 2-oxoglutarate oxidoreductase [Oscillospiraceae bacterium]|jgi:2-oxoglutarate ferredoxin oxidoreductase subunit beta|nr:2-oxoglutarate oxidoreductase [Oscillospiraceae bacterium]
MPKFTRPRALADTETHYCPGCTHGIIHRVIAEVIDEMGAQGETVGICPVGCSVLAYDYFNCDMIEASHGRSPAVATGVKRARPDRLVFTYQGDGDLAAIGIAEIIHAAARGENITAIFVNNTTYGMTGGQMAPTTLPGQVTQTSPYGRNTATDGFPLRICEIMAQIDGVALAERVAVIDPKSVSTAKKAVRKGFEFQKNKQGFSIIEVLSTCPTNWGLTPLKSIERLKNDMLPYYPTGVYREGAAR